MDMKVQTRNSLLTAMVCVALSSGTAWAAVPEVQVPAVQQSAPAGSAAALAEASVADVVSQEKAKEGRTFLWEKAKIRRSKSRRKWLTRSHPLLWRPNFTACLFTGRL